MPRACIGTLSALVLSVVLGGACGGRSVTVEGGAAGGASATGGTSAVSGASGRAGGGTGNSAQAGASNGGASAGTGNICGSVACPAIACADNETPVFTGESCCPVCVSNCLQQVCPGVACGSGYEFQTLPGQCCPTCVPTSPTVDCTTGRQTYFSFQMMLAQKYEYGCASDLDCVADAPFNTCEQPCSYTPIWREAMANWDSNLTSEATRDCSSCPPTQIHPCPAPPPVACRNGQCVFLAR